MGILGGMPDAVKFIIVFLLILGILAPLLWRRFNFGTLAPIQRGRQGRLAVVEMTAVDVRHRLVLVKRDNVEHLLLVGGPTNIVVEANIARAPAAVREPRPIPDARAEGQRQPAAAEAPEWSLPLEQVARPPVRTADLDAALPEQPARTAREAMVDSMRAVRSGAAARRSPPPPAPLDLDSPPEEEEVAVPALTPPGAEVNGHPLPPEPRPESRHDSRPESRTESRSETRRPAAAPESPWPQPAPDQTLPPVGEAAPEPKREQRAVPPMPRQIPVAPLGAPPPRPIQAPPAAAGNANGSRPSSRTDENAPPPPPLRPAPAPVPPGPQTAPVAPRASASDESNLAEMAQRLEAALRRTTTKPEPPPPPPSMRPSLRPERPEFPGRKPSGLDAAGAGKPGVKTTEPPAADLKILSGKGKNEAAMDSLEDEMARMLGRPGKS